jgi:3-hydroxybutyryl-CoA dehydrogenase
MTCPTTTLIIEAVVEELSVKAALFRTFDEDGTEARHDSRDHYLQPSSGSRLAATVTSRPQDVIGLHFFNPAPIMLGS